MVVSDQRSADQEAAHLQREAQDPDRRGRSRATTRLISPARPPRGKQETCYLPQKLKLDWKREQLVLDVVLKDVKLNQFDHAESATMFVEPVMPGLHAAEPGRPEPRLAPGAARLDPGDDAATRSPERHPRSASPHRWTTTTPSSRAWAGRPAGLAPDDRPRRYPAAHPGRTRGDSDSQAAFEHSVPARAFSRRPAAMTTEQ